MKNFFAKDKRLIPPLIVLIVYLILGTFIYFSVFAQNLIKVRDKEKKVFTKDMEIHTVDVDLVVANGDVMKRFQTELTNKDDVMKLLETLRDHNGFYFSKTSYTYGTVIDEVTGIKAAPGDQWRVFDEDVEITFSLEDTLLQDGHTYTIRILPALN